MGNIVSEHGRRILALSADAEEENIKREDWNNYEILAVGHRIWLAINGKVTVALRDEFGELSGQIALQIHGGPAQTVTYKDLKLVHNPKVEMVALGEDALNRPLVNAPENGAVPSTNSRRKQASNPNP